MGGEDAVLSSEETSHQGYLRKSHRGGSYGKRSHSRLFRSHGFHVEYLDDSGNRKGRFDLRNVLLLKPSDDDAIAHGIDIVLSEGQNRNPGKRIVISLEGSPSVMTKSHRSGDDVAWCSPNS